MLENRDLIETLCDLEIPSAIRFSPDGQSVLWSTELTWAHYKGKHAVSTLWLGSTGKFNSSRKLTSGSVKDYAPAWHPDGNSILFISDRAGWGKKWAIYIMSLSEGSDSFPITAESNEKVIEKFVVSPTAKHIAFISVDEKTKEEKAREDHGEDMHVWGEDWPYARLRIVDMRTKEVRSLDIDRHVTDLCWSPDGTRIGLVSCRNSDFEERFTGGGIISTVGVDLNAVKDVCILPKVELTDLVWAVDGRLYFCLGVPADRLFAGHGVYTVDPDSSSMNYDRVSFGIHDDVVGLIKGTNGQVLAKVEYGLESCICTLDGQILYRQKQVLEVFDAGFTRKRDETVLAVATSDIKNPVEVYTTTTKDNALTRISNQGHALRHHEFGTCEYLQCRSMDGQVDLEALYLTPKSTKHTTGSATPDKLLPTVVMIHGGPNTRITNAFNTYYYMWTPYLLSKGYGILLPNYRGSSGRGERFASFSIDGVGKYDYEDIIAITQHVVELGLADKDRLLVSGWSQGGFLTSLCCVRNGDHGFGWRFRAAIAGAGIYDSDSMALSSDLGSVFQPELHNGRVAWNMDLEDTRNRRASPLWEINAAVQRSKQEGKTVIPPMLILHGEEDKRCHVSQAWGLRRALQSHGLAFELVTYTRQGHVFAERFFWVDMAVRFGRWCDRYIGSGT